ncbi:thiamine phosphate synthase [Sutcliffiella cohnii]|uniref:Thiamine phosphate synthase n=1 Tax=Sutcliffiella cohnii TaxID=33932 RepID=A0A223KLQ0_9BACI|nr:thiazole tautomerase TenI [Sutcliffiella cohnii]AST90439.1 thiamine phosphate synthase [Sutcliffiella cohnii]
MKLHVITDGKKTNEELTNILRSIHPYVDRIHIREKEKTARELAQLLEQILKSGVPANKLIVNDRVDVAQAFSVRGVQLAFHSLDVQLVKQSFPRLEIGCSVHSIEEAAYAEKNGADFLLYGHIFTTSSKLGQQPRGIDNLKEMTEKSSVPIIGIGGITPKNLKQVASTGASGVAVMSGIMESKNPVLMAKRFQESHSSYVEGGEK